MELRTDYLAIFNSSARSDTRFWERHGGMPCLKGCTVVDVGCGMGKLCVEIAQAGAAKVVGIDIEQKYITFAVENLKQNYPHLQDVLEFKCMHLKDYDQAEALDYVVAKDSFEHVIDLAGMINEIKKRLKPGGRLYAGFGPLWKSAYGDHWMTKSIIPWGHLLKTESMIIKGLRRRMEREINSIDDLHLNRLAFADYRRLFRESGLEIVRLEINQSRNIISKLFSLLRKMPFLEEYFTHNIFCILEKSET